MAKIKTKRSSRAIIYYNKKLLLFLRDNDPTIPDPNKWCLVGGQVDKGESFRQAVQREINEEINVLPKSMKFLGKIKTPDTYFAFFLVNITKKEKERIKIGNEGQMVKYFTIPEINNLNLAKDIKIYLKIKSNHLEQWLCGNNAIDLDKLKIS